MEAWSSRVFLSQFWCKQLQYRHRYLQCTYLGGPCRSAPQEWGTTDDDPPSWFKFQMDVLEQTLRVL